METAKKLFILSILIICYCSTAVAESSSPYLKILNKDANIDRMPLLLTTVDVNITGLIVEVKVTQVYKNNGTVPLEAQYVFPGSRQAAVHQVTMKIGDRLLEAEIQEKEQARATYNKAKEAGKTTTLLEQNDPGLFTMMVANILPGDEINVELVYTERLIPQNGKYQFKYPAIGIPSVLNNKKGHATIRNDKNMGFDMIIKLNSAIAIDDIHSLNHAVDIDYINENEVLVLLDIDETLNFNEDFIVEYSLQGQQINSGILLYQEQDNEEGYFLMMIEPPKKINTEELVPREYIFVVDSSGSMQGPPLKVAQDITKQLLTELKPHELFNVVLFAGGSKLLNKNSMSPSKGNIKKANKMVDVSNSGGATNLLGALEKVNTIEKTPGISRTLIVLTDGVIDVSLETLSLIRNNNDSQNVFVIGVSQYRNDLPAVEAIAQAGNGQEFIISDQLMIDEMQQQFLDYIRYPLLTDIEIKTYGFVDVDLQPSVIPDLFAKRPLFLTGKFTGNKGSIEISGTGGKHNYSNIFDLARVRSEAKNESIKYLWAKEKIQALGDGYLYRTTENKQKIAQITQLGLDYKLLTEYTSFVAVDNVIRKNPNQGILLVGNANSVSSSGFGYIESNEIKLGAKQLPPLYPFRTSGIKTIMPKINNQDKDRKSITFILGKDKNQDNLYYASATTVFEHNPTYKTDLIITDLSTIAEVKNYLEKHKSNVPWGIINIITHSSPWSGLSIKLESSDRQTLDVFALNNKVKSSQFKPLNNSIIDNQSELRIFGCGLGKHQQLLSLLSVYFGGNDTNRPVVKSPVDYIYVSMQGKQIKTFKNGFALVNPKYKDQQQKIIAQINKANPQLQLNSLKQWKRDAVQITTSLKIIKNIDKLSVIELAKKQKNFQVYLHEMGANWQDFEWIKVKKEKHLVIIGRTILLTQKVEDVNTLVLTALDLNDETKTAIVRPYLITEN